MCNKKQNFSQTTTTASIQTTWNLSLKGGGNQAATIAMALHCKWEKPTTMRGRGRRAKLTRNWLHLKFLKWILFHPSFILLFIFHFGSSVFARDCEWESFSLFAALQHETNFPTTTTFLPRKSHLKSAQRKNTRLRDRVSQVPSATGKWKGGRSSWQLH